MSEGEKKKKYPFVSNIRLPDMSEIIEAASDFSAPAENKLTLGTPKTQAQDIMKMAETTKLSKEQIELQKLGLEVIDEQRRREKEKVEARAAELRRLRQEREEQAMKKQKEEEDKAFEEKRKAIQEAKDKAFARKEAERVAAEEKAKAELEHDLDDLNSYLDRISDPSFTEMPYDFAESAEEVKSEVSEASSDISDIAENPFEPKKQGEKQIKEKEEFKETVLEDDYQETQEFKEDSSEEVDSDYWDF